MLQQFILGENLFEQKKPLHNETAWILFLNKFQQKIILMLLFQIQLL